MKEVLIYSTTTCPYCKMLKDYLTEKGVEFKNIFVDQDETAAQKMIQESGQMGVPVTRITDESGKVEHVLGFDKHRINQLLGLS